MDPSLPRPELTPAQVLTWLPADTRLGERLTEGLSNEAWRLTLDGSAAVLRITRGEQASRLSVREEVAVMRTVGDLAPDVLAWGDRWLVTRWRDPGDPRLLGARLARLHSLAVSPRLRVLTPRIMLQGLRFPPHLGHLQEEAEALATTLAPPHTTLCHQDLNRGNERGSWFLDWEYAARGDPRFDLHTVLDRLDDRDASRLLADYIDGGGPARPDDGVRRACQLIDLHWHATHGHPSPTGAAP